jgi:micrococcal nuclease
LFIDGAEQSVNHSLIADGYAWEYGGGTKMKDFNLLAEKRKANNK